MRLLIVLLFAVVFCAFSTRVQAGLVFTIAEIGGNVRVDYSGTVNLSGLGFVTSAGIAERNIRLLGTGSNLRITLNNVPTLPLGRLRNYNSPFSSMPPAYLSANTPAVSSFGGKTVSLATLIGAFRVDENDMVGDVWTGSGFLQWNNRTVAGLGIDPAPKTWVFNNAAADSITMTVITVPEPSSLLLIGLAGMGGLVWNRRRVVARPSRPAKVPRLSRSAHFPTKPA